jgi:hypothetical protein
VTTVWPTGQERIDLWWVALAASITLRPEWQIPITWSVEHSLDQDAMKLHVRMRANDFVTGKPTTIHMVEILPNIIAIEDDVHEGRRRIARVIRRAVEHELDECLLVSGVQMRDPHSKDPR